MDMVRIIKSVKHPLIHRPQRLNSDTTIEQECNKKEEQ